MIRKIVELRNIESPCIPDGPEGVTLPCGEDALEVALPVAALLEIN